MKPYTTTLKCLQLLCRCFVICNFTKITLMSAIFVRNRNILTIYSPSLSSHSAAPLSDKGHGQSLQRDRTHRQALTTCALRLSRHRAHPQDLLQPSVSAQERTTCMHAQPAVRRHEPGSATASGSGRRMTAQEAPGWQPRRHQAVLIMELECTASRWRIRLGIGARHPLNPRRVTSTEMVTIAIRERGAGWSEGEAMTRRTSTLAGSIRKASRATRSRISTPGSMRCNRFYRWVLGLLHVFGLCVSASYLWQMSCARSNSGTSFLTSLSFPGCVVYVTDCESEG